MKNFLNLLLILLIANACNLSPKNKALNCPHGTMQQAWYTEGEVEIDLTIINDYKADFLIIVDTNIKASNFISFNEKYKRERSKTLDTSDIYWHENWETLSIQQKLDKVKSEKNENKKEADSLHLLTNNGQQQVLIFNNTDDTISIQMQDWSFICVLQAQTEKKEWKPIEYWNFSSCGNSYHYKDYLPKMGDAFITELPKTGNFETKLRYKLLGVEKFYYSNEFEGKIDYCRFEEDSTISRLKFGYFQPKYKLDKLIDLAM